MKLVKMGTSAALLALASAYAIAQQADEAPAVQEVHVTNDPTYDWGEVHIAINTKNPNNLAYAIVGVKHCEPNSTRRECEQLPAKMDPPVPGFPGGQRARGFYEDPNFSAVVVFYSFDRGKSWGRVRVPRAPTGFPTLDDQGDPSVTAGPDGTFYASWDANDWGTPEQTLPRAGVAVSKSTDGGRTWSPAVLSGVPVDGPKLAADLNTGTIYIASSTYLGPRSTGRSEVPMGTVNTRWLASSRDGVKWTPPRPMGGVGGSMSAAHGMLATAFRASAQGSLFGAANAELCGKTPPPCTIFQTTTDAGATWTRHVMAVPNDHTGVAVAADPARKGHFAVASLRNKGGEYHVYRTQDAGKTWAGPAIVTDDQSRSHYHGTMAFSRDGVLGIVWRSREATGQPAQPFQQPRVPYSAWAAISRDGGATFSAPVKLDAADSPGGRGTPGDDYSGIALDRDRLYAAWADWRPGTRGGYFAAVPFNAFKPAAR